MTTAVLTQRDADKIRARRAAAAQSGEVVTIAQLALEYGVSESTITRILKGTSYRTRLPPPSSMAPMPDFHAMAARIMAATASEGNPPPPGGLTPAAETPTIPPSSIPDDTGADGA